MRDQETPLLPMEICEREAAKSMDTEKHRQYYCISDSEKTQIKR